jgi:hypothetical protein
MNLRTVCHISDDMKYHSGRRTSQRDSTFEMRRDCIVDQLTNEIKSATLSVEMQPEIALNKDEAVERITKKLLKNDTPVHIECCDMGDAKICSFH